MRAKKSHHLFSIILVLGLLVPAFSVQADTGAKATPANTLAVDPLKNNGSLIWNTFLGGYDPDEMIYDDDYGADVVVDAGGNVYITGTSSATWGAPVNPFSGGIDAFVAKLNNRGVLQWSTFLGGPGDDDGIGITVDVNGNVFVTGQSDDGWGVNPILPYTGMIDGFVAKLDPGGALVWNSFLGGNDFDNGYDIGIDGSSNLYVTGYSFASWGSNIVNPYSEGSDAYVARLNGNGVLLWNSFLGGTGEDDAYGIAVDGSGYVVVTGTSDTEWGTPQNPFTDWYDAFVARLDPDGALIWNTFLGGAGSDYGNSIAVDGIGAVVITGTSDETWGTEPRRAFSGYEDAFVARLDTNGSFVWNTFLGGVSSDQGWGIALDPKGVVYVTGISFSTWGTPLRPFAGYQDVLVARLDEAGNLEWNTFLGGAEDDYGYVIAADGRRGIMIVGTSWAAWGTPVKAFAGGAEAFVARLGFLGKFISSGSQDGWVLESKETSNLGGIMNAAAPTFNLGDDNLDKQYRGILSFNTGSLPDDAVVTSSVLKIRRQGIIGTNPFNTHRALLVDLRKGSFGTAGLQAADFNSTATVSKAGTFSKTPLQGNWYQAVLNSAALTKINNFGLTQFRLRFDRDDNDDMGADYLILFSGNSTAANRPVLELQYYIP